MDNISYMHLQTPAHDSLHATYGRQLRVFDTTKAPSVSQYTPLEEAGQPDIVDPAWPPGQDHASMSITNMLHLDYTSNAELSLQDFMDVSPGTSLMEYSTLSPVQEESPLEWMPINDASDPHPQIGSRDSQRSSSKPRRQRTVEAIERRKHQNRRAQQAFRARREERQEQLRAQIIEIKHQHEETLRESEELHKELTRLKEENSLLKKCIQSSFASTTNDFSFSLPWQS